MSALYWRGPIALEGVPTTDGRLLAAGALQFTGPVPAYLPSGATEEPAPACGSLTDMQRWPITAALDGWTAACVIGYGRYVGTRWQAGDKANVAITSRALVDPETTQIPHEPGAPGRHVLRDVVLMRSLALVAVVLGGDQPAWPQTVVEFTRERPT